MITRDRQTAPSGYDSIVALGKELQRPASTLLALAAVNDPFVADRGARRQDAEWFATLWDRFGFGPGSHLRRIHYRLISQAAPILLPDGGLYLNTNGCWQKLINASRDARYLGLVPVEHFVDRRSDEAREYLTPGHPAALSVDEARQLPPDLSYLRVSSWLGEPPDFVFVRPVIAQRFHIELWAEKTSENETLLDLGRQYALNVVTAPGEISLTRCYQLIQRALASGRAVRILYISDFDPGGMSMPVACARKIEFLLRRDNLDLDIQVRPVVLTHEQAVHYRLPRTPIKEGETRATAFERRFGEGATELDALEELHPGELRRLLEAEIARYYDADLDDRVSAEADNFRNELDTARGEILRRHARKLAAIQRDHEQIVRRINADLKAIAKRYGTPFKKVAGRYNRLVAKIAEELEAEAPDPDLIDWPEPDAGDEDDDPLFDSTRGYVEQIDRFKRHQGKATSRKTRRNGGTP